MHTTKTFLVLAAMAALFGGAGYLAGGWPGVTWALALAAALNLFAWWKADHLILDKFRARPIVDGPIMALVKELSAEAHMPCPRVYIIDTQQPNAFATGRDPSCAAVAVTRGLLDIVDAREMKAVLAHEMTHIRNHDTLMMTVTATVAGALSTLAGLAMLGGFGRRLNPLLAIVMIVGAPLAAMLIQMAIARSREYAADHGAALLSRDPEALASALAKIGRLISHVPNPFAEAYPATAPLFIVNPLGGRSLLRLFATHPSMTHRIDILRKLARRPT